MAKVQGISVKNASKLMQKLEESEVDWDYTYKADLWADSDFLADVLKLGISKETIELCRLGMALVEDKKYLAIPVFYNGFLVDIRRYNVLKHPNLPKMFGDKGAAVGYAIPFDIWRKDKSLTYIFEGEKDMLMARDLGLNAITLTGGAGASPNEFILSEFEGRDIVICYDNDKAGRDGMKQLYQTLMDVALSVKYIDIGEVVKEEKEDFYDYVRKYQGDMFEFTTLPLHDFTPIAESIIYTPIKQALSQCVLNKKITSLITITSEFADPFGVPTHAIAKKVNEGGKKDVMMRGETKSWFLENENVSDMLPLIELDAKSGAVNATIKKYMGVPTQEESIDLTLSVYKTVYKTVAVDKEVDNSSVSLDLYSFEKLEVGGQYRVSYRLFTHPTKNQKIVGIVEKATPISDTNSYRVNKDLLNLLKTTGTVAQRLDFLYQSAKHHIAKHLDYHIWLTSELVFNSLLDIDYGGPIRGALDVFIIGDTQVGKSETTSALTKLYNFGHFLSLKTSTTVGLIGGSNKVDGAWCNTIGAIPRQNNRLVVMEEFSGARKDFIKTMTDIRSSGILRIVRAAGEMIVPCKLRMITISNPINDEGGNPRFLSSFPNGVMPVMELITSAEDVARYDGFLLVPKRENRFNPFSMTLVGKPIPKEAYEHKASWVITRTIKNATYERDVESYIWERSEELNEMFECNFPVFGTTTAKKVARFSAALASLILNVDESYENIIITKEIVDYVIEYMKDVYTSTYFRLDDYKREYDAYHDINKNDINEFQKLYAGNSVLFDYLAKESETTRANIMAVSGLERDDFGPIFNKLVSGKFLRMNRDTIFPTEKFRKVYKKIDKNIKLDVSMIATGGETNEK